MKFLNSYTIENETCVHVSHKGEIFFGTSKCHPDDKPSMIRGGRIAEERAQIKALKYEYRLKKIECEAIRRYVDELTRFSKFDKESATAKAMFHHLNTKIKEVNELADIINKKEFNLRVSLTAADRIKNRKEDKTN